MYSQEEVMQMQQSHPVRVRGLKHILPAYFFVAAESHPVRVRGLKL